MTVVHGRKYDDVAKRHKRLIKNRKFIKNPKLAKNLHEHLDNCLKLNAGDSAVKEVHKEISMGNSGQTFSGKYTRSCGYGEGKPARSLEGWVEVESGKWRKVY